MNGAPHHNGMGKCRPALHRFQIVPMDMEQVSGILSIMRPRTGLLHLDGNVWFMVHPCWAPSAELKLFLMVRDWQ